MTSDLLVSQVDWLASLASLTGATMPKNTAPDSYNYLGSWLGKEKTDRPWVIEQASNHTLSVRTKDWKYIEPNDGPKMIQWGPKIETGNSKEPQLYKMKEVKEVTNYAGESGRTAKYPSKRTRRKGLNREIIPDMKH